MCVPRLSCLVGRGEPAFSCCGRGCPRAPQEAPRLPRAAKVFGDRILGAEPPLALALCPIPLEQAVNCVKGPSGRRCKRPKCSCSAFVLSLPCLFSGIRDGAAPLCMLGVSAHPFPVGSRRQIQAAEVREEKGQSQIPRWGWNCRRKSQCEDLRRAFLHHPALPQSFLCLAGEGLLLLTWECKKTLGLVSHSKGQE